MGHTLANGWPMSILTELWDSPSARFFRTSGMLLWLTSHSRNPHALRTAAILESCPGHDNQVSGAVLVVSLRAGELQEICSAKVQKLGERWTILASPCASTRFHQCCVFRTIGAYCGNAIEMQNIIESGMGWAWSVNDLKVSYQLGKIWCLLIQVQNST